MDQQKKILIIDDDERNIFALSAILRTRNFACLSAFSGADGLRMMKSLPDISVVLVDMMMPGMDGYELIETIRGEHSINNIPVIAVTAQAMAGDREKCLQAGADAYISKPVDIDKLMIAVNELLKMPEES